MSEAVTRERLGQEFGVSRETLERLDAFVALVIAENMHQNLISASTIPTIWQRHILDSAQLLALADTRGCWLDLGTGAGFPGIVVAIMRPLPIIMVESRRKRIEFLQSTIDTLGLPHAKVFGGRLEVMPAMTADIISARAFASLGATFGVANRFTDDKTLWLLSKGRRAQEELEAAQESWQGRFTMTQSITDSEAAIVVAQNVKPRGKA